MVCCDRLVQAESVFLGFGVLFFYCGAVFNYFLLLLSMVREKQQHLRTAMLMMGLSRGSLWLSWLAYVLRACYGVARFDYVVWILITSINHEHSL